MSVEYWLSRLHCTSDMRVGSKLSARVFAAECRRRKERETATVTIDAENLLGTVSLGISSGLKRDVFLHYAKKDEGGLR